MTHPGLVSSPPHACVAAAANIRPAACNRQATLHSAATEPDMAPGLSRPLAAAAGGVWASLSEAILAGLPYKMRRGAAPAAGGGVAEAQPDGSFRLLSAVPLFNTAIALFGAVIALNGASARAICRQIARLSTRKVQLESLIAPIQPATRGCWFGTAEISPAKDPRVDFGNIGNGTNCSLRFHSPYKRNGEQMGADGVARVSGVVVLSAQSFALAFAIDAL